MMAIVKNSLPYRQCMPGLMNGKYAYEILAISRQAVSQSSAAQRAMSRASTSSNLVP